MTKRSLDSRKSSKDNSCTHVQYSASVSYELFCTSMYVKHCHYRLIRIRLSLTYFHFHNNVQNVVLKSIHQLTLCQIVMPVTK